MQEDYEVSLSQISLVGSAGDGTRQLICPLVALALNKLGFKWCAQIGAAMSAASMTACYLFKENFVVFLLCYGFVMGAGGGFLQLASTTSCAFYFHQRQALAIGLASAGQSRTPSFRLSVRT